MSFHSASFEYIGDEGDDSSDGAVLRSSDTVVRVYGNGCVQVETVRFVLRERLLFVATVPEPRGVWARLIDLLRRKLPR